MTLHIHTTDIAGASSVLDIANDLSAWFTANGRRSIAVDLEFQKVLLASNGQRDIGFLSFFTYDDIGIIGWMGVRPDVRRQGVGKALFEAFRREMAAREIKTLQVSTLGDAVDYEPYAQTRAFYRAIGFATHKIDQTDNPECPEMLTLRMSLSL